MLSGIFIFQAFDQMKYSVLNPPEGLSVIVKICSHISPRHLHVAVQVCLYAC